MSILEKSKSFTLLIISDVNSKIRKYSLSNIIFRFLFVFVLLFITVVVFFVYNLVIAQQKLKDKVVEIERMEERINYEIVSLENLTIKTKEIEAKTKILEKYLSQIEELDKMVRDITGKGGFEEKISIYNYDLNAAANPANLSSEIFYYITTMDQEQELDDIDMLLDALIMKVPDISIKLSEDKLNMENFIYEMEHTPDIWPTWGKITTLFCDGRAKVWRRGLHKGLDIANKTGTQILSSASGVVIFSGWHGGYGRKVIIFHGFGYTTVYAHLNSIYVNVGQEVEKGQKIGTMGNTGRSYGSHLHYEVYIEGIPVNPLEYLP